MLRQASTVIAVFLLIASVAANASQQIWLDMASEQAQRLGVDFGVRHFNVDDVALRNLLGQVPHESLGDRSHSIQLPLPDGSLSRFMIVESPVMEPALAAKFPEFKTFKVYGVDDPTASGRVDITSRGFHGMLQTSQGRVFIDPDSSASQADNYIAQFRSGQPAQGLSCGVHELDPGYRPAPDLSARAAQRIPGSLLSYRLAVAATEEYVTALGGTVMLAQAGIVTAINRVNEIYERDLGIRLMLVAGNDQLIDDGPNVSFSNFNAFAMFAENQAWIDSEIGSGGYDIGHVFSTGGGGLALLGATCDDANKAKGVTGLANPIGDPFYIDFVAHEIGHQFSAEHTFNGTTLSCGGFNRFPPTAFEPGSGSTIMAYAGLCAVEDLQTFSDATFHAGSIAQIDSFTAAAGSCHSQIATNPVTNADPVVDAISGRTIPHGTAFTLAATASDTESGMALTYQWDQMDTGTATNAVNFGTDQGDNPLFRSYEPQSMIAPAFLASRDFPALGTQVQGLYDDAEVLPCQTRDLNFRLTVRDNDSGQDTGDVIVSVTDTAGPFVITNFNDPLLPQQVIVANNSFTVAWDVANTDIAPISCANVDIDLLTFDDAGYTQYSVHSLEAGVLNDGSELINFPDPTLSHPRARIRVKCSDNIFYDINGADINIIGTDLTPLLYTATDNTTFFNNNGTTGTAAPVCNASAALPPGSSGGGGSGAFGYIWLLLLGGLATARHKLRRQG